MSHDARGRTPVDGDVVVVGGYGAVGRSVCEALVAAGREVVVAGRRLDAAVEVASGLGGGARALQVDAGDPDQVERALADAAAVVMCVERDNAPLARRCLERGLAYLDVSATPEVVASVASLDDVARRHRGAALVSVGLAPGVTNVLARLAHADLGGAAGIDLTLGFGLAGDNGPDSRRWILDGLTHAGQHDRPRRVDLVGWGRRRAHAFPFSDQYTLRAALGCPVTTRMCFESRLVTSLVFGGFELGVLGLARRVVGQRRLAALTGAVHLGTDRFVIQVDAHDRDGRSVRYAAAGNGECRASGRVAALATELILDGTVPPGVHHLDEVADHGFLVRLAETVDLHGPRGGGW